jgi:hypothetical protein
MPPSLGRRVIEQLNSHRFVDKSVGQCWATLLDEGTYPARCRRCTGCCAATGRPGATYTVNSSSRFDTHHLLDVAERVQH